MLAHLPPVSRSERKCLSYSPLAKNLPICYNRNVTKLPKKSQVFEVTVLSYTRFSCISSRELLLNHLIGLYFAVFFEFPLNLTYIMFYCMFVTL